MTGRIAVERNDFVATVWMDSPPVNYFDLELITSLADTYGELDDAGTRAIVLAARGKHFCAGADFRNPSSDPDAARHLYRAAARLFDVRLPVIAAVQGGAIGGGLGLALSADFRVGDRTSWFTANFSRLGFTPGFGISVTLPRVVGTQRATELLVTGRRIDSKEAADLALLDRLVPDVPPVEAALRFAREVAAAAPLAVESILRTMRGDRAAAVRECTDVEVEEQARLRATADFAEGIAAARERREPRFTSR